MKCSVAHATRLQLVAHQLANSVTQLCCCGHRNATDCAVKLLDEVLGSESARGEASAPRQRSESIMMTIAAVPAALRARRSANTTVTTNASGAYSRPPAVRVVAAAGASSPRILARRLCACVSQLVESTQGRLRG